MHINTDICTFVYLFVYLSSRSNCNKVESNPFNLTNPFRILRFLLPFGLVVALGLQHALTVGLEEWWQNVSWPAMGQWDDGQTLEHSIFGQSHMLLTQRFWWIGHVKDGCISSHLFMQTIALFFSLGIAQLHCYKLLACFLKIVCFPTPPFFTWNIHPRFVMIHM